jgi:hypothetical protein
MPRAIEHFNGKALVYLSGPITGLTYEGCTDWRDYVSAAFPNHILGLSPLRAKTYLKGLGKIENDKLGNIASPLVTDRGINTRDHNDVLRSSVMLVNLLGCTKDNPDTRISIGTVAEMAWAWDHQIPQIVAMEDGNVNIHSHPMLNTWIDFRVNNLDEAIRTAVAICSPLESMIYTYIGQTEKAM